MKRESLTNEEIIDCVKAVKIPDDELVVVGAAALQLFGIKRTLDIDVIIPVPTLARIIREDEHDPHFERRALHSVTNYEATVRDAQVTYDIQHWKDFCSAESIGTLTLLPPPNDRLYSVSFEELHDEAVAINGVLVSPPERILDWTQAINRPDYQSDIELIQAHLAQPSTT